MEIFLSAVCGELASRSMNFIVQKYSTPPAMAVEDGLQRILLRAQVIVDEAAGRHITNRGMLQQLNMLRDAMHRGYYLLDTFRYGAHKEDGATSQVVSHSSALSKFSYARRLCLNSIMPTVCLSSNSRTSVEELQEVQDSLNTMIIDVTELVVFLKNYPSLYRQPYCMHLLLDKCMFARQMEIELITSFLLRINQQGEDECDVLPIVGPGRAGKSTLVAHVCNYERVRDHFAQIMFLREEDFRGEKLATLMDRFGDAHQNSTIEENGRLLIVVEVVLDLDEDAWKILRFASKRCVARGSKIIITHLEIARMLKRSFTAANSISLVMSANFDIHFLCKLLTHLRAYVEKHLSIFGEHPYDLLHTNKPMYLRRMGTTTEDLFVSDQYQTCSSQEEFPQITLQDVMSGNTKPHGTFKVLAWRSQLPPYNCCIYTCQIRDLQTKVKRKRSLDNNLKCG